MNVITLSDAIDVLSRSVSANQAGNEQIADGVTTVAQKTAEQMDLVEKNLELIESSNTQMQDIKDSVSQIKSRLDGTVQTSKQGIDDINGYSDAKNEWARSYKKNSNSTKERCFFDSDYCDECKCFFG